MVTVRVEDGGTQDGATNDSAPRKGITPAWIVGVVEAIPEAATLPFW